MNDATTYQRDINQTTERRIYTIEERMERYETKINQLLYIQLATITIIFISSPQILTFLKILGV